MVLLSFSLAAIAKYKYSPVITQEEDPFTIAWFGICFAPEGWRPAVDPTILGPEEAEMTISIFNSAITVTYDDDPAPPDELYYITEDVDIPYYNLVWDPDFLTAGHLVVSYDASSELLFFPSGEAVPSFSVEYDFYMVE